MMSKCLSVLGGSPAFQKPVSVGSPDIPSRDLFFAYVNAVFDRKQLANDGPLVREFENTVAQLAGVKYCVAVSSGTMGLQLAARALNLSGEVILPSFTFAASAHALKLQGIIPKFCDIDPGTHNVDPASAEALISERTSAIMGVHVWGIPCPVKALAALAERYRIMLLYDACHALGCSYQGNLIGSFGDAGVISFNATKVVHTGEGGAVVTNREDVACRLRSLRSFGFTDTGDVIEAGCNGKMHEISAALGLSNLRELEARRNRNREYYKLYRDHLFTLPGISVYLQEQLADQNHHYQFIPIEIGPEYGLHRDLVIEAMRRENVYLKRYFYPGCHKLTTYQGSTSPRHSDLPITDAVSQRILQLPTGAAVDETVIGTICDLLERLHENATTITSGWSA